eukprot:16035_1
MMCSAISKISIQHLNKLNLYTKFKANRQWIQLQSHSQEKAIAKTTKTNIKRPKKVHSIKQPEWHSMSLVQYFVACVSVYVFIGSICCAVFDFATCPSCVNLTTT